MNDKELRMLESTLKCTFKHATWRPYHQYNLVAYKACQTYLAGYNVVISVWSKKTKFKIMDDEGKSWLSFDLEHKYSLYLWSKEQIESYLLQQVAVQKTKEMFSDLAYAELEKSYVKHWSPDPCLY